MNDGPAMTVGMEAAGAVPAPAAGLERMRTRPSAWSRFRRHRLAAVSAFVLLILVLAALLAPVLTPYNPNTVDLRAYRKPPSSLHLLGTDSAGRDVLSRLLFAARVSLSVGLVAVGIYVVIGVLLGGIAGFFGRWVDSVIMRFTDMVLSFPAIVVIITLVSILGPNVLNVMLVIGLLGWPAIARLVRGEFLSLREREFVTASRAIGASSPRIIFRHILPNALTPVVVAATFGIAQAILLEAGLSFLGLGVQPPTASWGNMLNAAQTFTILEEMPWLWLPPGAMIIVAVLAINFFGDGLRDLFDPRK